MGGAAWGMVPNDVLTWMALGGSPALGCAIDPATRRDAALELAGRQEGFRTGPAEAAGAPTPTMPNDPWTEREAEGGGPAGCARDDDKCTVCGHKRGSPECAGWRPKPIPDQVAARHQAIIDRAFAPASTRAVDAVAVLQAEVAGMRGGMLALSARIDRLEGRLR